MRASAHGNLEVPGVNDVFPWHANDVEVRQAIVAQAQCRPSPWQATAELRNAMQIASRHCSAQRSTGSERDQCRRFKSMTSGPVDRKHIDHGTRSNEEGNRNACEKSQCRLFCIDLANRFL